MNMNSPGHEQAVNTILAHRTKQKRLQSLGLYQFLKKIKVPLHFLANR